MSIVEKLSSKAVGRARLSESVSHNLTKFPLVIGGLGFFGMLFFGVSLPCIVAVAGGLIIGAGSFGVNYLIRGDTLQMEYIRGVQRQIKEANEAKKQGIRKQVEKCVDVPEAADFVSRALVQFDHAEASFDAFMTVLTRKLDAGELTFGVFAGPAEELANSVLDNLNSIVTILEGMRSIEIDYARTRLAKLKKIRNPQQIDNEEMATLAERVQLFETQMKRVDQMLVDNEEAITMLEVSTSKVGEMKTEVRFAKSETVDEAVADMRRVANRAKVYDRA